MKGQQGLQHPGGISRRCQQRCQRGRRHVPQFAAAHQVGKRAAFQLGFLAMMGNVKAFILSICGAVVFAILLVSANTMAMSIRERTREVAVLKTLGFTRRGVLGLFVSEAVALSLGGGLLGAGLGWLGVFMLTHSKQFISFFPMRVTPDILVPWRCWLQVSWDCSVRPSLRTTRRKSTS